MEDGARDGAKAGERISVVEQETFKLFRRGSINPTQSQTVNASLSDFRP